MQRKSVCLAAMVFVTALAGCTIQPDRRVEELPPLQVVEHRIEPEQILNHCQKAMGWWNWALLTLPVACATINFEQRTCNIYVSKDAQPEILEHERLHCDGYDHSGRLRTAYANWRRENEQKISARERVVR